MAKRGFKMEVIGLKEFKDAFKALDASIRGSTLDQAVKEGAELIAADARERVARDTGNLAKSITVKRIDSSPDKAFYLVGPNKKQGWYGHFVEFGTAAHDVPTSKGGVRPHPGAQPRPFLFPALEHNRSRIHALIRDRVERLIESHGR